jgi:hypothetical protein
MSVTPPAALSKVLSDFEARDASLKPFELAAQLEAAAGPAEGMSPDTRRACLAEIVSLRFMVARRGEVEPWGIYFQPTSTATDASGAVQHLPDAHWMDAEVIEYWKQRARQTPHAALRARYADLAREIGDLWNRDHPTAKVERPRAMAQLAANAYIDAVQAGLAPDDYVAWQWLERALDLAATIQDPVVIDRAKLAAFDFRRAHDQAGDFGFWWRLDDIIAGSKGVNWTQQERDENCAWLRKRLASASDPASGSFDPHDASGAADRLARWVDATEKISALRTAGAAFETMAAGADAMVATGWLEDLSRRYRAAGLSADANRVDATIMGRAGEVQSGMQRASASVEISDEKMQQWLGDVVRGPRDEGLARIGALLINNPKRLEGELNALLTDAPIMARIPVSIIGAHGFTSAVIGSIENDMPGRLIHRAADTISMSAPFLHQAFTRATTNYSLDAAGWLAYFAASPIFPADRQALLKIGIDAWIAEDYLKAVHILVPQVEAALRECLISMGESPMRPAKTGGGFEAIGMGAILNHDTFKARIPNAMRLHLRALYSDPRGINLRNKMAHGQASENLLGRGMANWVVHSLVAIRAFGLGSMPSPQSPSAPPTP